MHLQFEHLKVGVQAESAGLRGELGAMRANVNAVQAHVSAFAAAAADNPCHCVHLDEMGARILRSEQDMAKMASTGQVPGTSAATGGTAGIADPWATFTAGPGTHPQMRALPASHLELEEEEPEGSAEEDTAEPSP